MCAPETIAGTRAKDLPVATCCVWQKLTDGCRASAPTRSVSGDIWGQKTPERALELGGGRVHDVEAHGAFVQDTAARCVSVSTVPRKLGSRLASSDLWSRSSHVQLYVYPEARARQFWLPLIDGDSTFQVCCYSTARLEGLRIRR